MIAILLESAAIDQGSQSIFALIFAFNWLYLGFKQFEVIVLAIILFFGQINVDFEINLQIRVVQHAGKFSPLLSCTQCLFYKTRKIAEACL